MFAKLIEGNGHQPMIRFEDGRLGVPINLLFSSRNEFLSYVGRRVEIRSQLSEQHYSVHLPGSSAFLAV